MPSAPDPYNRNRLVVTPAGQRLFIAVYRLLAAGPKLRGKDADRMLAILLVEDAQPATAGKAASDRSTRRLFERLVSLGAVRELTGRPTFRLYGL